MHLDSININDSIIDIDQIKYSVNDGYSCVDIYIGEKVSFRVSGDAYLTVMTKWLAESIYNNIDIKDTDLVRLVEKFEIPEYKIRNAVQILEVIEKINER
jgi:hypothetical protein